MYIYLTNIYLYFFKSMMRNYRLNGNAPKNFNKYL